MSKATGAEIARIWEGDELPAAILNRLDSIIELLQPKQEHRVTPARYSREPKSRIERAAAELGVSEPALRDALRAAWNKDALTDQDYANATEVGVDRGVGNAILMPEYP